VADFQQWRLEWPEHQEGENTEQENCAATGKPRDAAVNFDQHRVYRQLLFRLILLVAVIDMAALNFTKICHKKTLNLAYRSFKVIHFGTNRCLVYGFI